MLHGVIIQKKNEKRRVAAEKTGGELCLKDKPGRVLHESVVYTLGAHGGGKTKGVRKQTR